MLVLLLKRGGACNALVGSQPPVLKALQLGSLFFARRQVTAGEGLFLMKKQWLTVAVTASSTVEESTGAIAKTTRNAGRRLGAKVHQEEEEVTGKVGGYDGRFDQYQKVDEVEEQRGK